MTEQSARNDEFRELSELIRNLEPLTASTRDIEAQIKAMTEPMREVLEALARSLAKITANLEPQLGAFREAIPLWAATSAAAQPFAAHWDRSRFFSAPRLQSVAEALSASLKEHDALYGAANIQVDRVVDDAAAALREQPGWAWVPVAKIATIVNLVLVLFGLQLQLESSESQEELIEIQRQMLATIESIAENQPRQRRWTTRAAMLRTEPHRKAGAVLELAAGTEVAVLSSNGDWRQVLATGPQGMIDGWVNRRYLRRNPSAAIAR